jgi:hypothetical protein
MFKILSTIAFVLWIMLVLILMIPSFIVAYGIALLVVGA